ncbi:MAG: hypothetical protein K5769_03560 [Pseudobutyrivibrio sp.]|nr:hypothetical protein [Pseudobutyrivibrio sp.]
MMEKTKEKVEYLSLKVSVIFFIIQLAVIIIDLNFSWKLSEYYSLVFYISAFLGIISIIFSIKSIIRYSKAIKIIAIVILILSGIALLFATYVIFLLNLLDKIIAIF